MYFITYIFGINSGTTYKPCVFYFDKKSIDYGLVKLDWQIYSVGRIRLGIRLVDSKLSAKETIKIHFA